MSIFKHRVFMALANEDGSAGGADAGDDRGDEHVPDDDLEAENAKILADAKADGAKDEDEADEGAKKVSKDDEPHIPKARFDAALKKEREARESTEAKLREAQAALETKEAGLDEAAVEEAISGLEEQVDQALADGDKQKAAALRKEIRTKVQALATQEAIRHSAYATAVAVERVRYDAAVAAMEAQYPAMNPDHEKYDADTTGELLELKAAYEATGMGSTDALKKAAKYVFKTAPEEVKKEDKKEDKKVEADDAEAKKAAAEKAAKMKEDAIRKGQDVKSKQPAKDGGNREPKTLDATQVSRMSDKDFSKLDKETLAQLRGDVL